MRQKCIFLTLLTIWVALFISCTARQNAPQRQQAADSLLNEAYEARNYDSLLTLANELSASEAISDIKAGYWRGYAYSRQRKMRQAEMAWKDALADNLKRPDDLEYYAKSANRLAGLLYMKSNYESTLRVAVPAIKLLQEKDYVMNSDYANLQTFLGNCQLKLGRAKEASVSYAQAYQKYLQLMEDGDDDIATYTSAIIGVITITDTYLLAGQYREAYDWTGRMDALLLRYKAHPQATGRFIDKQQARLNFYRACALEGLGNKDDASRAYQDALTTNYAKTGDGLIEATSYLMEAGRCSEAADNFAVLEKQIKHYDIKLTLDAIQTYLLPKFRANMGANRKDSAIVTAQWICNALDSAIVWDKQDAAAELATIYDTQQKDAAIAEQKADLSRQRLIGAMITLIAVIMASSLFIFFRHQAAKRLESAYNHLEIANARAEESSRMKSNFIQQISHEIRTPLNVLSGFTQIITTPGMKLDDATLADINRQITENTDRITGLVNKMLELSDAGSRTIIERTDNIPVAQIAAEAAEISGINNAKHLTFDLQLAPDVETTQIQTNLRAAVRALSLVLDNARKFTAPAEARRHQATVEQQHVALVVSKEERQIKFAVEDSGPGIPVADAERIFDEFVQLDEYYDGTGIGLTIARSLTRRLGGELILDTTYQKGARFVLSLPCF